MNHLLFLLLDILAQILVLFLNRFRIDCIRHIRLECQIKNLIKMTSFNAFMTLNTMRLLHLILLQKHLFLDTLQVIVATTFKQFIWLGRTAIGANIRFFNFTIKDRLFLLR